MLVHSDFECISVELWAHADAGLLLLLDLRTHQIRLRSSFAKMDVQQLCVVLQGCLSSNREERSQSEARLKQHETSRGQLVNLLRVASEPSVDLAVRQVASITFKQAAKRHWEPEKEGAPCLIAPEDKQVIRSTLLDAIISAPHIIQTQLQEVLGAVVYSDFPEAWPGLLETIMGHLTSNDQPRMYGGLVALRVLARKYEFKADEDRAPMEPVVNATFPVLLPMLQQLLAAPASSGNQVPEFIKLICKVFWSSTFMGIPSLLVQQEQFQGWMMAFHTALRKPLPWDQLPAGADEQRKWPWFKALKWVLHNTYRIFNRYGEPRLCSEPTDKAFAQMFETHVSSQFLQDHLYVLQPVAGGQQPLSPRVVHLALQYLTHALELKEPYKQLKPHVDGLLVQVVLPQLCFDDEDAELWEEDPQEFVRKGYDVLEDMMSPRTSSSNFVQTVASKRAKNHLTQLMARLVEVMNTYAAAAKAANGGRVPEPLARQMDGALLAIGALSDTLKAKDPYRSQLEALLSAHVLPLFHSPHGHLRAKAAWLAKEFADIEFSEGGTGGGPLFNALLQAVINSLNDSELPVRVEAAMALRSFVDELDDTSALKPILAQLMDSIFKLMSEVENEDLVFTLETMVEKFGDEIAPYAVNLAQNLTAAFWKYSGIAEDDADEDKDDMAAVAAYGCLKALNTLLDAVAEMKHLLPTLEEITFGIMSKCISSDGQDVLEDVLQLLAYFTYFGELSPRLWSLWPQIHAVALDFGVDYWEDLLIPLDNYISKGTATFINSTNPNYQESLYQMVEHTLSGDYDELNMIHPVKLMSVVLQNCTGQVDRWLQPYLQLVLSRLAQAENRLLRDELLVFVANALYYNAGATMQLLRQFNAVQQLFGMWFGFIFERNKSNKPAHFKSQFQKKQVVLGLLALLGNTPDEVLPPELANGLPQLLSGLVRLLLDLKEQQEQAAKAGDSDDDEGPDDVDADDGEDEEEDGGQDAEGDEYLARLRKEALRLLKGEQQDDDDDDEDWDEDDEDEMIGTPLDDMDPFVSFADVLSGVQASMPGRYSALMAGADANVTAALQGMSAHAAAIKAKKAAEQQQQ